MTFLLNCTIRISVIVTVALAVTSLFRRQSAAWRHGILVTAAVCAALTPLLMIGLPSWNVSLPFIDPAAPLSHDLQYGDTAGGALENQASAVTPGTPTVFGIPLKFVAWTWIAGMAANFAILILGWVRLTRVASFAEQLNRGFWVEMAAPIARRFGILRPVRILLSRNASILVTWGALRPKLLVPAGAEHWPEERVRVVLSHELAHVRRLDWLVQVVAESLRSVFWFNPLLWDVCRRLRQESEYACDDAVIAAGIAGTEYASHLLELARILNVPDRAWSAAFAMARPSTLQRRFSAMLNPHRDRRPLTRSAMLAIAVMALCATLPVAVLHSAAQAVQSAGKVTGTVSDANGALVSGATVVVSSVNGTTEATTSTNRSGTFTLNGLSAGSHVLQVFANGFGPSLITRLELRPAQDLKQDVKMDIGFVKSTEQSVASPRLNIPISAAASSAGGSIVGIVRDPSGLPVPQADVTVTGAALNNPARGVTGSQGEYGIASLPPGVYRVAFRVPGFKTLNIDNVNVTADSAVTLMAGLQLGTVSEEVTVSPSTEAAIRTVSRRGPDTVAPSVSAPVSVGGNVRMAMLLRESRPAYPADALAAGIQGAVIMQAVIGVDGLVKEIKVISGHPLLQQVAVQAVSQWQYSPTLLNAQPVEVLSTITMNFKLEN